MHSAIMYLCFEFIGHYTHVSQTSGWNNWSEEYHTVGVSVMYTATTIRYFWCTLMRNRSRIWTDFVSKKQTKRFMSCPGAPAITWIERIGSVLSVKPCKNSKFNIFLIGTRNLYRVSTFTRAGITRESAFTVSFCCDIFIKLFLSSVLFKV